MRRVNYGTVGIVGLGPIGGSIGLRLREIAAAKRIIGFDQSGDARKVASDIGCVDQTFETLNHLGDADILILAVPPNQVVPCLVEADVFCKVNTIVTDTGSVKTQVVNWTLTYPLRFKPRFVGGHPFIVEDGEGIESARADLFDGVPWVLTPTERTDKGALQAIEALTRTLGAKPVILSPEEHDRHAGVMDHLPRAIAGILAQMGQNLVHSELAGRAWHVLTEYAGAESDTMTHVFLNNRDEVVSALDDLIYHLTKLRGTVEAEQYEELLDFFEASRKAKAARER